MIPLYHAWLPSNPETASLVGDSSYLQLQNNVFNLKYFDEDEDVQKMKDLESIFKSTKLTEKGCQQIGEMMKNGEEGVFLSDHLFRTIHKASIDRLFFFFYNHVTFFISFLVNLTTSTRTKYSNW